MKHGNLSQFIAFILSAVFAANAAQAGGGERLDTVSTMRVHELIQNGKGEDVVELINAGQIDANSNFASVSLIELAVMYNEAALVEYLVDRHEEKIREDSKKAFLLACANGYTDVAQLFLKSGLDPNTGNAKTDSSCIFLAIDQLNADLVSILLKYNADLSAKNSQGLNPSDFLKKKIKSARAIQEILPD